jgi:hypothetical protein
MNTPRTPVTPVDLMAVSPYAEGTASGDASMVESIDQVPSVTERFLRSPWKFWAAESVLFIPVALFLLQGLLHEFGQLAWSDRINSLLFSTPHTFVGDIFGPLMLPVVGIVLALARIRDARRGRDRQATIGVALLGITAIGIVLAYALVENVGHLFR